MNDNDGYPKECAGCGKPVILTGRNTRHDHNHTAGVKRSWHWECDPARGSRPPRPA